MLCETLSGVSEEGTMQALDVLFRISCCKFVFVRFYCVFFYVMSFTLFEDLEENYLGSL